MVENVIDRPALPGLEDTYDFDEAKAREGVWLNFGQFGFKMRHVDLADGRYQKIRERLTRPWRQHIERGSLDEKQDKQISCNVFAEAFLVDWRTNELDGDGNVTGVAARTIRLGGQDNPFSVKAATDALVRLPKLFAQLTQEGMNIRNYRYDAEQEAADLGN